MEDPGQSTSEHSANSAREKLSSYLGSQMKVVISDGRILIGEFMCTDKERNLILGNCDEYIPMNEDMELNDKQEGLSRMLSLAIIPGHHISSIAVAKAKCPNVVTDPSSVKYQNQHEDQDQHKNQDQHEKQHEGQLESLHQDHCESQQDDSQDQNQHESEEMNKDQIESQSKSDRHKNQHQNEHGKNCNREGTNTIDTYTEEHGEINEDIHTPQQHLTLQ